MKDKAKEKHPVYRWIIAGFWFLLVIGILMLLYGLAVGDGWVLSAPSRTV